MQIRPDHQAKNQPPPNPTTVANHHTHRQTLPRESGDERERSEKWEKPTGRGDREEKRRENIPYFSLLFSVYTPFHEQSELSLGGVQFGNQHLILKEKIN